VLSLGCATVAFALVLRRSLLAAALLAVYPAAVLLSVDARAYAMCAMFVTIGVLLLMPGDGPPVTSESESSSHSFSSLAPDADDGNARSLAQPPPERNTERRTQNSECRRGLFFKSAFSVLHSEFAWEVGAALAFVAAAYTHYYGLLFFPLLLLRGRRGIAGFALAAVLAVPTVWLALHQPAEALAWNSFPPLYAIANASFAGVYSDGLFASPPVVLAVVAFILLVPAVARSWRFAPAVLLPITGTLLLAAFGRSIYFPLRFESVIAAPLMLWIAASLERWPRRRELTVALMTIGVLVVTFGIADHWRRPPSEVVRALALVGEHVAPQVPIVANSYAFLEAHDLLGDRVIPLPPDQAQHPGWWKPMPDAALAQAIRALPAGGFVWIGPERAPELVFIRRARHVRLLGRAGSIVVGGVS